MTRTIIWILAFAPVLLVLIARVREAFDLFPLWLLTATIPFAVLAELVLLKQRGAPGVPSTPLGNTFAKLFLGIFVAMIAFIIAREMLSN